MSLKMKFCTDAYFFYLKINQNLEKSHLTFDFGETVFYGNAAFLIGVLSTTNGYLVFSKRFSFFRKHISKLKY